MFFGEDAQVVSLIHQVSTTAAVLVEILGLLNHGSGNVDPVYLFEMLGHWLGETAHATSEIERSPLPRDGMQGFHLFERSPDFPNAGLKELACIPAAVFSIGVRENRPQWIAGRKQVPVLSQSFQIQI
jgi:hypothetical protein